ncbi:cya1 [Symbiodinium microadriaticum]|nr:cya1 [Symbiodinium microadriaticum]
MLSMAKLEFLQRAGAPLDMAHRSIGTKSSTRFSSFRSFFSRSRAGSSASENDSSSSEDQEENDMEEGQTGRLSQMLMHVAPREVVHMRESFVYMVAGLKSFARYMDPEIMRIVVQSKRQAQLGMGKAPVTIFFSSSELGGADGGAGMALCSCWGAESTSRVTLGMSPYYISFAARHLPSLQDHELMTR